MLLALLLPLFASASPPPGTINLRGNCTIEKPARSVTVPLHFNFGSKIFTLGFTGVDGGEYKIEIANNGGNRFEATNGAVLIGFARAHAEVRNPPRLCPTAPADAREECEAENRRNNPPIQPLPEDHFVVGANTNGSVSYEFVNGKIDKDLFGTITEVMVSAAQINGFDEVSIDTPRALFGGVQASCSLKASRN